METKPFQHYYWPKLLLWVLIWMFYLWNNFVIISEFVKSLSIDELNSYIMGLQNSLNYHKFLICFESKFNLKRGKWGTSVKVCVNNNLLDLIDYWHEKSEKFLWKLSIKRENFQFLKRLYLLLMGFEWDFYDCNRLKIWLIYFQIIFGPNYVNNFSNLISISKNRFQVNLIKNISWFETKIFRYTEF